MLGIFYRLKRLASIFFVFLMLFNALGFYGLLQGLRYKSTLDLVERLDDHQYTAEETVTLTVPLTMPYQLDTKDYERVDGEIQYNGEFYRLVKQKFDNDTLYIVCIKDHTSKRINQALMDYVKTFRDNPMHGKQSSQNLTAFIKDFLPTSIGILHACDGWNYSVASESIEQFFSSRSLAVVTPPPQS